MPSKPQRGSRASVTIGGERTASMGAGLLVLLGVLVDDTKEDAEFMVRKLRPSDQRRGGLRRGGQFDD